MVKYWKTPPSEPIDRKSLVDAEVKKRMAEYQKYWNAESGTYEIEVGTKAEWICTEIELYDDIREAVENDLD